MNVHKLSGLSVLLLVAGSLNASYAHLDGTPTIQEQVEQATKAVNNTALELSDAGFDASVGLYKKTLWESEDKKSQAFKFGASLSIMKMAQGKMSINDLFGPGFEFETVIPGADQKFTLKLKLFSLLAYAKMFTSVKLPGSLSEFLATMSKSFGSYIKQSDKSVAAAFLTYFWFNHCGGAARIIKGDAKDDVVSQKRMILSAVVGFMTSYGIKNFNNSKLGKAAVAASALLAAMTMVPSSVIDRTPAIG